MAKLNKINLIRDELYRIASKEDLQDLVAPTMMAYWSYTRVMVLGKIDRFHLKCTTRFHRDVPGNFMEMYHSIS